MISLLMYGVPVTLSLPTKGATKLSGSGKSGNQPRPKTGYSPLLKPSWKVFQGSPLMVMSKSPDASSCRSISSNSGSVEEP